MVLVLLRKKAAKAGAVPAIHAQFRRFRMAPSALRRPEQRMPYLRAIPGQMIFIVMLTCFSLGNF